jgi:hypothetical protein
MVFTGVASILKSGPASGERPPVRADGGVAEFGHVEVQIVRQAPDRQGGESGPADRHHGLRKPAGQPELFTQERAQDIDDVRQSDLLGFAVAQS